MNKKINFIILSLVFILFNASVISQEINSSAPDFTVQDLNGDTISLSALKGKVIVLDFWASWCVPCKKSMPHLIALYSNHKDDSLVVIGVNVDTELDKIKEFQNSINVEIPFPVIFDKDSKLPPMYNVEGMPTTIVINKAGMIKYKEVGYNNDLKERLDRIIKELLEK